MSDSVYIYSTLSQSTAYTLYKERTPGSIPQAIKAVTLNAGANVIDKALVTPYGVVTQVSAEDYELLKENRSFKTHVAGGFLKVSKSKTDPEKVAKDMTPKDKSAQPTTEDLVDQGANPAAVPAATPAPADTSNKKASGNKKAGK